jgi:hypothetical protein
MAKNKRTGRNDTRGRRIRRLVDNAYLPAYPRIRLHTRWRMRNSLSQRMTSSG